MKLARIALLCLAMPFAASSQDVAKDTVFKIGPCQIKTAELVKWDEVASRVDRPARVVPATLPFFPMHLRTRDGYSGRIVLSMVIDTAGRVEPGSVSIEESDDARLSSWGCLVALQLRYFPATVAGKPVMALTEQPLSYSVSRSP